MIILHSNGHWMLTFYKDLLNRVLVLKLTKGILKEEGSQFPELPQLDYCCEFIVVLKHTATNIKTLTLRDQNVSHSG